MMNIVLVSPHFPPNFYNFAIAAHQAGLTVLGIGDMPLDGLRPKLRSALTDYYAVSDLHHYDALIQACGYFTYRYGKIDLLESHNEYWLEQDARLREDFNIPGLRLRDMEVVKRKSRMKQVFSQAGIDVAPGGIVTSLHDAEALIAEIGYPVVAKPDIGVGAAETYQIATFDDLVQFFTNKPAVEYIFERYIYGQLYSFDGITDRDGRIVFSTAHTYRPGIMDVVNADLDVCACSLRVIPEKLEDVGKQAVFAFNVRERFFHIEFIHPAEDDQWVALEMNMRPPGGPMLDVFNYANDIDIYREWVNVVAFNNFTAETSRPYYCAFIGRKAYLPHLYSREEILTNLKEFIIHHEPIPPIFARAMGNYAYLVRSPDMAKLQQAIDNILALKAGGKGNER
jgi:hypothetical protein